jgi:hypothetical protein
MNDFELLRDLRALRGPVEPPSDLWKHIAQRIEAEAKPAVARRRRWLPLAAAAVITMSFSVGVFSLAVQQQMQHRNDPFAMLNNSEPVSIQIQRARLLAANSDPSVASAAVVIDSANSELEQALQQDPDSVFLASLLHRTHAQRLKLSRLDTNAG